MGREGEIRQYDFKMQNDKNDFKSASFQGSCKKTLFSVEITQEQRSISNGLKSTRISVNFSCYFKEYNIFYST